MSDTKYCEDCKKTFKIKSFPQHIKTERHKKKIETIKEPVNKINYSKTNNALNEINIILKSGIHYGNVEGIYNELKKKYKDSTIELMLRIGLLKNYLHLFTPEEEDNVLLFISELKEKVMNDRPDVIKTYNDFDLTKLNDSEKIIVKLYLMIPLRMNEFLLLVPVNSIDKNNINRSNNYIVLEDKLIYLFNTKVNKIARIKINDDIVNYVKNNFTIGERIYNKHQNSLFKTFKKLNTNTYEIRRIFAQQNTGIQSKNILNHSYCTHVGIYKNQHNKV